MEGTWRRGESVMDDIILIVDDEPELASILPPADDDGQDLSWMVGFEE